MIWTSACAYVMPCRIPHQVDGSDERLTADDTSGVLLLQAHLANDRDKRGTTGIREDDGVTEM